MKTALVLGGGGSRGAYEIGVCKALEELEGVSAVTMSLEAKTATVEMSTEVSDEALTAAVTEAGYEVKGIV